jgi:hypothetical protein
MVSTTQATSRIYQPTTFTTFLNCSPQKACTKSPTQLVHGVGGPPPRVDHLDVVGRLTASGANKARRCGGQHTCFTTGATSAYTPFNQWDKGYELFKDMDKVRVCQRCGDGTMQSLTQITKMGIKENAITQYAI